MNTPYANPINDLKNSTTFHMSLGSKELFHSNFLHWLSIIDWDAFLQIMRDLAGGKKFWWETGCNAYCPQNNNLEVRREHHSFDLSIYILVEENTKNGKTSQKWIPVLILENKVKSIPYKEQLDKYQGKAEAEWRKKDKLSGRKITFILLSLWKGTLPDQAYQGWNHNSYEDLANLMSNLQFTNKKPLDQDIITDYIGFINALSQLANNSWKLQKETTWDEVYPWKTTKYSSDQYVKLRIHDLWEKIHYEQLLSMLMGELQNKGIYVTQDKDEYQKQSNSKPPIVYCASNYAHNIGIFEAWVKKGNNDYIIQVQGDTYCRGFICKKVPTKMIAYFKRNNNPQLQFQLKDDNALTFYTYKDKNPKTHMYYSKAEIRPNMKICEILGEICDDILYII